MAQTLELLLARWAEQFSEAEVRRVELVGAGWNEVVVLGYWIVITGPSRRSQHRRWTLGSPSSKRRALLDNPHMFYNVYTDLHLFFPLTFLAEH